MVTRLLTSGDFLLYAQRFTRRKAPIRMHFPPSAPNVIDPIGGLLIHFILSGRLGDLILIIEVYVHVRENSGKACA